MLSPRLVTNANVPAALMAMPFGNRPASSVLMTAGGEDLRSMTEILLSCVVFVGSAGFTLSELDNSAMDSSGVTATICGGPDQLDGAFSSAMILGGRALRSMSVTVSGGALGTMTWTPSTMISVVSLAETAICARTGSAKSSTISNAK